MALTLQTWLGQVNQAKQAKRSVLVFSKLGNAKLGSFVVKSSETSADLQRKASMLLPHKLNPHFAYLKVWYISKSPASTSNLTNNTPTTIEEHFTDPLWILRTCVWEARTEEKAHWETISDSLWGLAIMWDETTIQKHFEEVTQRVHVTFENSVLSIRTNLATFRVPESIGLFALATTFALVSNRGGGTTVDSHCLKMLYNLEKITIKNAMVALFYIPTTVKQLVWENLHDDLSDIRSLRNHTNLQVLCLHKTVFGSIEYVLDELVQLVHLDLSCNRLHGDISLVIKKLTRLKVLDLHDNKALTGKLDLVGTNLDKIDISGTQIDLAKLWKRFDNVLPKLDVK